MVEVKPGNWGRGNWGKDGRPPAGRVAAPDDHIPPESVITVSGTSPPQDWEDQPLRRRFEIFRQIALEFGLVVHELDPSGGPNRRKRWSDKHVRLDDALDYILRKKVDGLPFEEFVRVYLPNPESEKVPIALAAAKSRAKVAVSRLYSSGTITKKYTADGKLVLFPTEDAYRRG